MDDTKPRIKARLITHGPQTRVQLIAAFNEADTEQVVAKMLADKEQVKEENGLISFVEPAPYSIAVDGGFISLVQAKLAKKGYRWLERIFNDGNWRNTSVKITRDTDCHWNEVYSPTVLTVGWGRFERAECWARVEEWVDKGGFTPAKV